MTRASIAFGFLLVFVVGCAGGEQSQPIACVDDGACPTGQICLRGFCAVPGAQDGGAARDGGATDGGGAVDGGVLADGGATDGGGLVDGGASDGGGLVDGGLVDGGVVDGGASDGGAVDAGGAFGSSCQQNRDCQSNICLQTSTGGVCSKRCSQDCPTDWGCRVINLTPVCVPPELARCATCVSDSECGGSFRCTQWGGAGVCLRGCSADGDCASTEKCLLAGNVDGGVGIVDGGLGDGGLPPVDGGFAGRCVPMSDPANCGACGALCGGGAGMTCCNGQCIDLLSDETSCGTTCANARRCQTGEQCCGGSCTDVQTSSTHCGACAGEGGQSCTALDSRCCGGQCVTTRDNASHCGACAACDSGQACCGTSCTNRSSDPRNCLACGNACGDGQACCGTAACQTLSNNDAHCGACGNACSTAFGSAGKCCGSGCVNKLTDATACGDACTHCGGTQPACCGGACADLATDKNHCGACSGGTSVCGASQDCCGGSCKSVQTDNANCGSCGHACGTGETCCGGSCKSFKTDPNNCGSCGNICGAGTTCCDGQCRNLNTDNNACGSSCATAQVCGVGSKCCSGSCKNITNGDITNCGDCNRICGVSSTLPNVQTYACSGGACAVATCQTGFADCNASAGCETTVAVNASCAAATDLGTVSDGSTSDPIEASVAAQTIVPGQSRWYRVYGLDGYSLAGGPGFKILAKAFNITAGVNVDLYAYRREHSSGTCSSTSPPVTPQTPATCTQEYPGTHCSGHNNEDRCSVNAGNASECVAFGVQCSGSLEFDDADVWIEVRHISGGCGTFDLKIRNNGSNDSLNCSTY